MDVGTVNLTSNSVVQTTRPRASSGQSGGAPPPATVRDPDTPKDRVSLSVAGKALQPSGGSTGAPQAPNPGNGLNFDNRSLEQRKFDLTDDNELVLKIVDTKTQQVVKQIPSEEVVRLRQAIQEGIENFTPDPTSADN